MGAKMSKRDLRYDGERLVPDDERLRHLLVEDLAKFHFANRYALDNLVLDVGCGGGQGAHYLARNGAACVVGVDISVEAVAYARDRWIRHNLAFCAMDGAGLAFLDHSFDLVTSIEVIEHLRNPDVYLAEIRRVLKHDGTLMLSTPNKHISSPTPGSTWPYHVHEFYAGELYALLTKHFHEVQMWGVYIPAYERHPVRRLVHWLAPLFKPVLPHYLRIRILPCLQRAIKPDLLIDDIVIEQGQVEKMPTLIAVCCA